MSGCGDRTHSTSTLVDGFNAVRTQRDGLLTSMSDADLEKEIAALQATTQFLFLRHFKRGISQVRRKQV